MALLALPLLVQAQFSPAAKPPPDEVKKGYDAISMDEAKKWLTFLATQCQGRGSGQPGFQKAADFVASKFKEYGLKPLGDDGSYFQHVPFYRYRLDPGQSYLAKSDGGNRIGAKGKFSVNAGGADIDVTGSIVFIRGGDKVALPENTVLKGKIVVIFNDSPRMSQKLRGDLFRGEAAATFTVVPKVGDPIWTARLGKLADFQPNSRTPGGQISMDAAKQLLKKQSIEGDFLTKTVGDDKALVATGMDDLRLVIKCQKEDVGVPNVVGMLEGSDPTLKEEYVAIGAHLDHLGTDGVNVWPGADDDGSGTTAVLCVAKAMSKNPVRPKRSVLFMTFCGEEMGLLGSSWYVKHPAVPLDKTQCLMQMDMVGRDSFGAQNGDQNRIDVLDENKDTMRLVGSKRISQEYDDIIQDVNQYVGFKFRYDAEDVYTRSDHFNFARNGVPIAFQFCGFTPDYHQPTDTVDKIDFLKLTNAAKLCYLTLFHVGDMDHPLKRDGTDSKKGEGN